MLEERRGCTEGKRGACSNGPADSNVSRRPRRILLKCFVMVFHIVYVTELPSCMSGISNRRWTNLVDRY